MSAGRGGVALSDLQRACRAGHFTSVTEHLLGTSAPAPVHHAAPGHQPVPQPLDRRLDHDGDWAWRKPVDFPFRTTPEDILEEAADLAVERLPWNLAVLVDHVVYGTGGKDVQVTSHERSLVEAMVHRCKVEVTKTLSSNPGRKPQRPPRRKPRVKAPCSDVVTKTADGRFLVNGYEVEYLIPEDYEPRDE